MRASICCCALLLCPMALAGHPDAPNGLEQAYAIMLSAMLESADPAQPWSEDRVRLLDTLCVRTSAPGLDAQRTALSTALSARLAESEAAERMNLLAALAVVGDAESVPAVAALLQDADARVRDAARRALILNGAPSAAEQLAATLSLSSDQAVRADLLAALGERGERRSLPVILPLCSATSDPVRGAALVALSRLPAAAVIAGLREQGLPKPLDAPAIAVMLHVASRSLDDGDSAQAGWLLAQIPGDAAPSAQAAALRLLARLDPTAAAQRVSLLLQQPAEAGPLILTAITVAADLPASDAQRLLSSAVASTPEAHWPALLSAMQRVTHPDTASLARRALSTPAQLEALRALGEVGSVEDVPLMASLADAASRDLTSAALVALRRIADRSPPDALATTAAQAEAPGVLRELIGSLAARDANLAAGLALELLADGAPARRRAGAAALAEHGGRDACEALTRALVAETDDALAADLLDATGSLLKRHWPQSRERVAEIDARMQAADLTSSALHARLLGRVGEPAALERLRAMREGLRDDAARDAWVRAVSDWPAPDALDMLLPLACDATDETQRVLALRGAVRLIAQRSAEESTQRRDLIALWQCAPTSAERLRVLGALQGVAGAQTLDFLIEQLPAADAEIAPALRKAVEAAARRQIAMEPESAAQQIERVGRALSSNAGAQDEADVALAVLRNFTESLAGKLTVWQVAGPYSQEGRPAAALMGIAFPPETNSADAAEWTPLWPTDPQRPWRFDLTATPRLKGAALCCYVRTRVWSDEQRPARLAVASDDGAKVWWNGEAVLEKNVARSMADGDDRLDVTLRPGWNDLMLKIIQHGGGFGFSCALEDPSPAPLRGTRSALPESAGDLKD